jgi:formamidopyrimidine-DNA glycosylase
MIVFPKQSIMPELPDLQVFSRNLNRRLGGKVLEKIGLTRGAKINVSAAKLKKAVHNQKLVRVFREGKELRFAFSNGNMLGIHLMLRGRLFWFEEKNPHKHTLAELIFAGSIGLALTDYQRNARIILNPPESDVPDALSRQANIKFWTTQLDSKAAVKNLLLDQHVVRGIGNAYADEILWDAGISPFSISNKIPGAKIKKLVSSVRKVLNNAEKKIAKADPGIIGGELRDFLAVHNSKKKHSPSGAVIRKKEGTRKTYYTDEQELFK